MTTIYPVFSVFNHPAGLSLQIVGSYLSLEEAKQAAKPGEICASPFEYDEDVTAEDLVKFNTMHLGSI